MSLLTALDRCVLKTLVYFDQFDFPMTPMEVLNDLIGISSTLPAVTNSLRQLQKAGRVSSAEGFYFLPNRDALVRQRKDRYVPADRSFKVALKNANLLRRLPFVRAIFIGNSLTFDNASPTSDIDFIIVTEPGRIWTTRLFCAGLMKLLNRRPRPNNIKDSICLSFYISAEAWSFQRVIFEKDITFAVLFNHWWPIFDPDNLLARLRENNPWMKNLLPNSQQIVSAERRMLEKKSWLQKILETLVPRFVEQRAKKYQLNILPETLRAAMKEHPKHVVMNDDMLKLHDTDRREQLNAAWAEKCKQLVPGFEIKEILKIITGAAGK